MTRHDFRRKKPSATGSSEWTIFGSGPVWLKSATDQGELSVQHVKMQFSQYSSGLRRLLAAEPFLYTKPTVGFHGTLP